MSDLKEEINGSFRVLENMEEQITNLLKELNIPIQMTGKTMEKLVEDLEIGVKNGYSVEQQIALVKKVYREIAALKREKILAKMIADDEELGLYDEGA